ncbi:Uncharacterised protein [Vibrio cholerae]|nr:Uncharacterised protein [Vibrio cholerae]
MVSYPYLPDPHKVDWSQSGHTALVANHGKDRNG